MFSCVKTKTNSTFVVNLAEMLNFAVNVAEMLKEATIPVCLFHESHSNICALQYMTTECIEIN